MEPVPIDRGFLASWTNIEWAMTAIYTTAAGIIAFVWRLSMRLRVVETLLEISIADRKLMHDDITSLRLSLDQFRADVRHDTRDVMQPIVTQLANISSRIDRLIDRTLEK